MKLTGGEGGAQLAAPSCARHHMRRLQLISVFDGPLRANIRETVDPLEFSVQGGEAKAA